MQFTGHGARHRDKCIVLASYTKLLVKMMTVVYAKQSQNTVCNLISFI